MAEVDRILKIQEKSLRSADYCEILIEVKEFDRFVSSNGIIIEKKHLILSQEDVCRYNVTI